MKIKITSVLVCDQEHALNFYTNFLGFVKKTAIPMGEYQWLTVVSGDDPDGVELLLEPLAFAPAKTYQAALFEAGIPATSFAVDDLEKEYDRLSSMGVAFTMPPRQFGPAKLAVLNDTCGNLIQLAQVMP